MRVAALDCGTNTLKLLVADLDPATGQQTDLVREVQVTRLGEHVDRTGRIAPEALARTLDGCAEYAAIVARLGVERLRFCATSAARDAQNGDAFTVGVRERLGVDAEVLTGAEEAGLSYAGTIRGLDDPAGSVLVVDVGGGSTELVRGVGRRVLAAGSADVCSVRLTERHLGGDPPSDAERAAAEAEVDRALAGLPVGVADADTVVGVSGSVVTIAAYALGLPALDPARLHGARLPAVDVRASCAALLAATVRERRALPMMLPGRADVIGGGAVVVDRVLVAAGAHALVISTQDLLDGIAWTLVEGP